MPCNILEEEKDNIMQHWKENVLQNISLLPHKESVQLPQADCPRREGAVNRTYGPTGVWIWGLSP